MPGVLEMEPVSPDERRQIRLQEIGQEWDLVDIAPLPSPPLRPEAPASVMTPSDEFYAEEVLKRQRIKDQAQQTKSQLSRAFSTKKKSWEYAEIYNALVGHVATQGSPGVAQALIAKLNLVGGNVNLAQKSRTTLLLRRKTLDLAERSQVLQRAVENRHQDMVEVLLPYADTLSLDTALPIAIRNQDFEIIELLVKYGANASQSPEGQEAFRQACGAGGQAATVALILSSDGRPTVPWISQCMVEAAQVACLDTVLALSQSAADGNHDGAAALKVAVALGRRDIALGIIMGTNPPETPGLNEAFEQLMSNQSISPNEKMGMAEILLCAGAEGDAVSQALVQASATNFIEMVTLLVSYGASIEYQDAVAVCKAVSAGKLDLLEIMLNGQSQLSAESASHCVELLPKKLRFEDRVAYLNLFLRKGAYGPSLDEALIDATESGDIESARLLLVPAFPGGKKIGSRDVKKGPRSMVFEHHAVASTEHKGALALSLAVKNNNAPIAKLILVNNPPSNEAMAQIFPSVRNLPRLDRFQVAEAFLGAGLSGPCVHSALQNAVNETPPHRDERLVALLLRSNADVNFNEGASITTAITQKDLSLLNRLLKANPTPEIAAKAVPNAMEIDDPWKKSQMITMLLNAGAAEGGPQVSTALATSLESDPIDKDLVTTLLQVGRADVNINGGIAVSNAVRSRDPSVLTTVLNLSEPNSATVERALKCLGPVPSTPTKAEKLTALLQRSSSKEGVSRLLIDEVQHVLRLPPPSRTLTVIKTLLANEADVNENNAEALCRAVAASDGPIVDLLFAAGPSPHALSFVMPHALRIHDLMDRLIFAQKVIDGGIPPTEVNRALVFAVSTYPNDLPLVNNLLAHADTTDGKALLVATEAGEQDIVELFVTKKSFSEEVLNTAFAQAIKSQDKKARCAVCAALLRAGATGEVVSEALLAAAADGDLEFGTTLVQNGASVEYRDGQAVVESCRSGEADVLAMLLSGNSIQQQTLQTGFQAATEISDLERRAGIFKLLLQQGVTGEVVDSQLISAERYGDSGSALVRLLLVYGANPDYNNGEAVVAATESAFLENLEMLLGVAEVGGKQAKPSSHTLLRAMDACWGLSRDTRFTVIGWIFKAGKPVPNAVHLALTRAVNEEDPEERLIQLLVANRASPTANGCQTLVDAARKLSASQFASLLESRISPEEATTAFGGEYTAANSQFWLSERGHDIARCLLRKGACGDVVGSALVAVVSNHGKCDADMSGAFIDLLLKYDADINYNHGEILQEAAAKGDRDLLRKLLQQQPNSESLTLAFPRIFEAGCEDEVNDLINLFVEYHDGDNKLDMMFAYPGSEPVMVQALSRFPRSTRILQALLDVGYYHDQMVTTTVLPEIQQEQVNLLTWALLQPQKKISSAVLNVLIDKGAKIDFETEQSRVTPLLLATEARRQDIVKALLLAGAEVDVTDAIGRSPLSMASAVGGELGITLMSNLLAAGASRNDGSLHNAARELNLQALRILVEYRHDPDFPSPQHGGRSALGELCLHATDSGGMTAAREKTMEKCINFLMQDSDITLHTDGKSILHLALESAQPLVTTKILLRADMWKHVNKSFNQYTDGKFTYSPTQYVVRVLPENDATPELLKLLKANRCTDAYYATSGPQPADVIGMPQAIQVEEDARKARITRQMREDEAHVLALNRQKELAEVQAQIWANQAELEDARKRRAHTSDMSAIREKAGLEEELFEKSLAQQRVRQSQEVAHQQALTSASRTRMQEIGDLELAMETQRQQRVLEWERDLGNERVGNATQLSNIRLKEREDIERMDMLADGRFRERIMEQKKLVDSQTHLAANLGNAGIGGRRQIGYIAGEVP